MKKYTKFIVAILLTLMMFVVGKPDVMAANVEHTYNASTEAVTGNDYFTISKDGSNASVSSTSLDGGTYTKEIKMESATTITFTTGSANATLTIIGCTNKIDAEDTVTVINPDNTSFQTTGALPGKGTVSGTTTAILGGAGTYTIKKGSVQQTLIAYITVSEGSSTPQYLVNFLDENDNALAVSQSVSENGTIIAPANPEKVGYEFKYWSLSKNGTKFDLSTPIISAINLYAVFEESFSIYSQLGVQVGSGNDTSALRFFGGISNNITKVDQIGFEFIIEEVGNDSFNSLIGNSFSYLTSTVYSDITVSDYCNDLVEIAGVDYFFAYTIYDIPTDVSFLVNVIYEKDTVTEIAFSKYVITNGDNVEITDSLSSFDQTLLNEQGFANATARTGETVTNCSSATEFLGAIKNNKKAINITDDLDMGFYTLNGGTKSTSAQTGTIAKTYSDIIKSHNVPLLHPTLLETGVSKLSLSSYSGITIFSTNGSTIKHLSMDLKSCSNIVVRNIIFDELWEWDESEGDTAGVYGEYDVNDWDYITILGGSNIWVDHCTFHKAYDGLIDVKLNSSDPGKNVTISWCKFLAGDTNEQFFVDQIDALETAYQSGNTSHKIYNTLRKNGVSVEQIKIISCTQKKGHLIGSSTNDNNAGYTVTLANNYYVGLQDRLPRLRAGNVHVYNCIDDATTVWLGSKMVSSISSAISAVTSAGGKYGVTSQAVVTTEGGAVYVENSKFIGVTTLVKNNQKSSTGNETYTGKYKFVNCVDVQLNNDGTFKSTNIFTTDGTDGAYSRANGNHSNPITFSFSNGLGSISYTYPLIALANLDTTIKDTTYGAGTISEFTSADWLKISY